jgi:hypothetical protein
VLGTAGSHAYTRVKTKLAPAIGAANPTQRSHVRPQTRSVRGRLLAQLCDVRVQVSLLAVFARADSASSRYDDVRVRQAVPPKTYWLARGRRACASAFDHVADPTDQAAANGRARSRAQPLRRLRAPSARARRPVRRKVGAPRRHCRGRRVARAGAHPRAARGGRADAAQAADAHLDRTPAQPARPRPFTSTPSGSRPRDQLPSRTSTMRSSSGSPARRRRAN